MKGIFSTKIGSLCLSACLLVTAVSAQVATVTGRVSDENGEPLPEVAVLIKGTTTGVSTGIDGSYSVSVQPEGTLIFSFLGHIFQEVAVNGRSTVNVVLQSDVTTIDEMVVVGYGVQKRVNLTGSVTTLTEEDLANKPVATTAQALAGLVPGLSVLQNSGRPGASAEIRLRGTGTFSDAGNAPLILIDGLSGEIDDVQPENIKSISFLKDAASASIYGNRAANGVILIETKRGSEGKIRITYNNSFGWQNATELPDFLPSWEYATYYNEAMRNIGNADTYTEDQIRAYRDGSDPDNYPNVNHLKWLLNSGSGFQQRHTLGVQGGNNVTTYNITVGYWRQEEMTAKTWNERYSANFNLTSKILESLTLTANVNAFSNHYKSPNGEPGSIDGIIGYAVREPPTIPGEKSDGTFGYQDNYSPEGWLASESFIRDRSVNINAGTSLLWETPLEGLSVLGRAGIRYGNWYNKAFRAETTFDENKTIGPNTLNVWSGNRTFTSSEAVATYTATFGDHYINVLGGTSRESYIQHSLDGYRNNFPNNYLHELNAGSAASMTNAGTSSDWGLVSVFGRVNYAFKDRYLFEANIRYDGSSRFAKSNRWGTFPSFSAGWRISEEPFWKEGGINNVVNNLKIRASWGVLGNQNIGTYPYQQVYELGANYPFGNPATYHTGVRMNTFRNPDVSWETTTIIDIGLDISLFKGRLNIVLDYFDKYTDDILAPVQVSSVMGRSVGQSNVGAVSNKGIEVSMSYNGKIGEHFHFTVAPNFTYVKNAVEKLADGATEEINQNRIVGKPLGIIYGYKSDGLFVDQAEIDGYATQLVSAKPGYIKLLDLSGPDGVPDGVVNATYDRTVLGSTTPKYYYGLNLSFNIKGIDFSALLQGLGGHKRLIGAYMAYAFHNQGQIQRWQADNRWTEENPDKWAKYPRLEPTSLGHAYNTTSDYWIRNASFLRVKNITIGYTLPRQWTRKIGMDRIRAYVSGQNLFSFNSFYKGWGPENQIATGDAPSFYPITSIYSFGFNFTF